MRENFELTYTQANTLLDALCKNIHVTTDAIIDARDFSCFKDLRDEIIAYLEDAGRLIEFKENF